jgi:hypothetical protein
VDASFASCAVEEQNRYKRSDGASKYPDCPYTAKQIHDVIAIVGPMMRLFNYNVPTACLPTAYPQQYPPANSTGMTPS